MDRGVPAYSIDPNAISLPGLIGLAAGAEAALTEVNAKLGIA